MQLLIAQFKLEDLGEFLVIGVIILISVANGIIQAIKKKSEAKERKRQQAEAALRPQMPPTARPAPTRTARETARPRGPIPLRPKPQAPRPSPVSKSPPPTNAPELFETIAEAIREAKTDRPPQRSDVPRPIPKPQKAKPAAVRKPPKRTHTPLAERHVIQDLEDRRESSSESRLGHVAAGVVEPHTESYGKAAAVEGPPVLRGVDLRKAIVLNELLAPPLALRETDDYFSP